MPIDSVLRPPSRQRGRASERRTPPGAPVVNRMNYSCCGLQWSALAAKGRRAHAALLCSLLPVGKETALPVSELWMVDGDGWATGALAVAGGSTGCGAQ